jgi:hypothetical protein
MSIAAWVLPVVAALGVIVVLFRVVRSSGGR